MARTRMEKQQEKQIIDTMLSCYQALTDIATQLLSTLTPRVVVARSRLDIAKKVLPEDHPQRQIHFDRVAFAEQALAICTDHMKAVERQRKEFFDKKPIYSCSTYPQYLRDCKTALEDEKRRFGAKLEEAVAGLEKVYKNTSKSSEAAKAAKIATSEANPGNLGLAEDCTNPKALSSADHDSSLGG